MSEATNDISTPIADAVAHDAAVPDVPVAIDTADIPDEAQFVASTTPVEPVANVVESVGEAVTTVGVNVSQVDSDLEAVIRETHALIKDAHTLITSFIGEAKPILEDVQRGGIASLFGSLFGRH